TAGTPAELPSSLKSSSVTAAAAEETLATAIPLSMFPSDEVSTYMRKAVPELTCAAASVAVTPFERACEKSTTDVGTAPPAAGTTRIDPPALGPDTTNFCALLGATE